MMTDINIAIVGHVSVGKTTILNALFRDKYGEVSMKRTTAGINYFRLVPRLSREESLDENGIISAGDAAYNTKSAETVLNEITADNKDFRNSNKIHEKVFEIELDEPLCKMREDANLVVVDVPGINEAGAGSKYRNFVEEKWHTFDVVVVVMDGKQGVNTEEQIKMLQFVKDNQENKREIPLIILLNKVDDPDDGEQSTLVEESRKELERLFSLQNNARVLDHMLQASPKRRRTNSKFPPVLIPTSAMHAYFYRTASLMTLDQFKKFDKDLIEMIGREEVGKFKWKTLNQDERYQAVHRVVSEEEQYKERLEATNFDKFLGALRYAIGDEHAQLQTIKDQLAVSLKNLSPDRGLANKFKSIYEKAEVLGMSSASLCDHFWSNFEKLETQAFADFECPLSVSVLSEPMNELKIFYEVARNASLLENQERALERMRNLVRHPLSRVFEYAPQSEEGEIIPDMPPPKWEDLSPFDWKSLCNSFLLLSYSRTFCQTFGREKILLETFASTLDVSSSNCGLNLDAYHRAHRSSGRRKSHQNQRGEVEIDKVFPFNANQNSELWPVNNHLLPVFRLPIPATLSDPMHWGHLAWLYCELVESQK